MNSTHSLVSAASSGQTAPSGELEAQTTLVCLLDQMARLNESFEVAVRRAHRVPVLAIYYRKGHSPVLSEGLNDVQRSFNRSDRFAGGGCITRY